MPYNSEVLSSIVFAHTGAILTEGHIKTVLHVSFDTKLVCRFLYISDVNYAEMSLFTVNMAHLCIIHLNSCNISISYLRSRLSAQVFLPLKTRLSP